MLIACEILPVDAAHGHTNICDFTSQKIILSALCEVNLYLEKRILIPRKVSLKYRGVSLWNFIFSKLSVLLWLILTLISWFQMTNVCYVQTRQASYHLHFPSHAFLPAGTIVSHCCESLLWDSQTHRWTHSNSAALDWSWRGKSRSWIKIWDARLRWSPSLLQFPGCNCDIRCLLLTVLDGTRRKDHSGHSNVLLVNTQ